MQTIFDRHMSKWKIMVAVGFMICVIITINELFLVEGNLATWMIKTVQSGEIKWDELAGKAHLMPIIPSVVILDWMRKKVYGIPMAK